MAKSGIQIAQVTGRHSLEENAGSLTFDPTPLIFAPAPSSPMTCRRCCAVPPPSLAASTFPARESGDDSLKASATADLRKIGFALASAGVFEGVSGASRCRICST